jgi:hypothetical protein
MREITARAYHVSRLDEDQVNILHDRETKLGYPGTPSEIRRKFRLSEIGQVPEELSENRNRRSSLSTKNAGGIQKTRRMLFQEWEGCTTNLIQIADKTLIWLSFTKRIG